MRGSFSILGSSRHLCSFPPAPAFRDETAREQWNRYALSMDIGADAHPAARNSGTQRRKRESTGLGSIKVPALVMVGSEDRRFLAAKELPGQ